MRKVVYFIHPSNKKQRERGALWYLSTSTKYSERSKKTYDIVTIM